MSERTIRANLERFGLNLQGRSEFCILAFVKAMKGRQYGIEETADAFLWFENGWKAARKESQ
jgi:hypothetical protein